MKTGYFKLHLYNEDLSEKHLYQNNAPNSSPWNWSDYNLELHNKAHTNAPWVKVFKPVEPTTIRLSNGNIMTWGEPMSLSSIFTIDEAVSIPRRRTSDPMPVSISGDWTWDTEALTGITVTSRAEPVQGLTSGVALREMQSREQLTQRFPSHADHVRSHQQALASSMQLQHENEMARRAAQREFDRRRQEEERTRQRRPWERVRNFFGRD